MIGTPETDGFLYPKMSEDVARVHARFPQLFALLTRCNRLAMATKAQLVPDASDQQKVLEATLFARALQSLQAAFILAERGMVADARAVVRGAAETTIYHVKTAGDAAFVQRFLEDHACNQRKLASAALADALIVSALSPEQRRSLEQTIAAIDAEYPDGKPAGFNIADVARSVKLGSFYTQVFRQMSGDSAHTSIASLGRHFRQSRKGNYLHFGPQIEGTEDTLHGMITVYLVNITTALKSWNLHDGREGLQLISAEWDAMQEQK